MNRTFFVAYLKNGRMLDFNKNCTSLNFSKDALVIFQEEVKEKEYDVIAVIPYDSICSIERITELTDNMPVSMPIPNNMNNEIGDEIACREEN